MGSRHFVLIDAGFNDLMRPAMYGSYHHISALAGDGRSLEHTRNGKPWWPGRCANLATCLPSRRAEMWKPVCCLRWCRVIIWSA
jgi:hypothetical protein